MPINLSRFSFLIKHLYKFLMILFLCKKITWLDHLINYLFVLIILFDEILIYGFNMLFRSQCLYNSALSKRYFILSFENRYLREIFFSFCLVRRIIRFCLVKIFVLCQGWVLILIFIILFNLIHINDSTLNKRHFIINFKDRFLR